MYLSLFKQFYLQQSLVGGGDLEGDMRENI